METAEEALRAMAKALLDGKHGWFHKVEDGLETRVPLNGKAEGDDIPPRRVPNGPNLQQTVEDSLDAMHERMFDRGR